ncbi:MAG: helix-turn-helix domain-containing protein [Desulfitobacterium sp.]
MADIGLAIRMIRKNQKLSLKDIAEKTELTISHLSQIERNLASPSLVTLEKVALALGFPISSFFVNPKFTSEYIPEEAQRTILLNAGITLRFLINNSVQNSHLGAYIAEITELGEGITIHQGDKFILVLEGEMRFHVAQREFFLSKGDTLYFNSLVPHWISEKSEGTLKLFVVTTPPEVF